MTYMRIVFKWESGSFNDNAIHEFKRRCIPFRFHKMQLEYKYGRDWFPVDYVKLRDDDTDNHYVIITKKAR